MAKTLSEQLPKCFLLKFLNVIVKLTHEGIVGAIGEKIKKKNRKHAREKFPKRMSKEIENKCVEIPRGISESNLVIDHQKYYQLMKKFQKKNTVNMRKEFLGNSKRNVRNITKKNE